MVQYAYPIHRINGIPFESRLPRFPASENGRVGVDSYGEIVENWDDVLLFLAVYIQAKEQKKLVRQ